MKTAILIILLNTSYGGQSVAYTSEPMPVAECDAMQRQLWAIPFETVRTDDDGAWPAVDAACVMEWNR